MNRTIRGIVSALALPMPWLDGPGYSPRRPRQSPEHARAALERAEAKRARRRARNLRIVAAGGAR